MTSSNGNIFRVTWHLCGEFTGPGEFLAQRLVSRSFDVFFDLRLNKRLSKQSWGWWFEMLSRPLWRHRNVTMTYRTCILFQRRIIIMWLFNMNNKLPVLCIPHCIRVTNRDPHWQVSITGWVSFGNQIQLHKKFQIKCMTKWTLAYTCWL